MCGIAGIAGRKLNLILQTARKMSLEVSKYIVTALVCGVIPKKMLYCTS